MRRISAIRLAEFVTKSGLCFCTNVSTELNDGAYLRQDTDLPKGEFSDFLTSRQRSALSYPHVWALPVKHCCTKQSGTSRTSWCTTCSSVLCRQPI